MASLRRCGRLAFHIQLPYSFLHFPYVESAIRFTHSKDFCGNCSLYPNNTQEVRSRDARWSRAPFSPLALHIRKKKTTLIFTSGTGSGLAAVLIHG